MFSCSTQAGTSLPDLTADLSQQFSVDISKEGLHKKFNAQAVAFLKALMKSHVTERLSLGNNVLTKHFKSINIKDSSKFSLPSVYNGDYPGFGNFSKTNGIMNIQYEYDLLSGNWKSIELTSIKINDQQESKRSSGLIAANELHIRDLGYITPTYLKAVSFKKAFFLNRLPAQVSVYTNGDHQLNWKNVSHRFDKMFTDILDLDVNIYDKERIPCRLIIERVPNRIYKERLKQAEVSAKKHGVGLTEQRRQRCRYNTFITNVGREVLPVKMIRKVYALRWQIELVFKTWKSHLQIDKIKKVKKERLECQLLAKLLWVLLNWRLMQSCNHYAVRQGAKGVSIFKFFKRCTAFSTSLRQVITGQLPFNIWLTKTFLPLIENTVAEAPVGKTTHYQTIYSLS